MRQQRRMVVRLLAGACLAVLILVLTVSGTQAAGPNPFAMVYSKKGVGVRADSSTARTHPHFSRLFEKLR